MEKYVLFISEMVAFLKGKRFSKKGNTFYIQKENNFGLIDFQKSVSSTNDNIKFTVNVGVASKVLLSAGINGMTISGKPSIPDCHWGNRIGFLMPVRKDYWWNIGIETVTDQLVADITTQIDNYAIPGIEKHISDNDLITSWLNGDSEGISDFKRYIYLTTLLKYYQDERLPKVVEDMRSFFKGTRDESNIIEHIKELGL